MEKYKPDDLLTDEELKAAKQRMEADLYVQTNKKGGMKKIEIVGVEQSYSWRADVSNSRDISFENMKISDLGEPNTLKRLIPGAMNLYLDMNMIYSWD
jgi:GH35 family endo-1,4-beta-xylanase